MALKLGKNVAARFVSRRLVNGEERVAAHAVAAGGSVFANKNNGERTYVLS
jgi:hypothetical protein